MYPTLSGFVSRRTEPACLVNASPPRPRTHFQPVKAGPVHRATCDVKSAVLVHRASFKADTNRVVRKRTICFGELLGLDEREVVFPLSRCEPRRRLLQVNQRNSYWITVEKLLPL
jgi:hypothetical protein